MTEINAPSETKAPKTQFSASGATYPRKVGPRTSPPKISPITRGSFASQNKKPKECAVNNRRTIAKKNLVNSRLQRVNVLTRLKETRLYIENSLGSTVRLTSFRKDGESGDWPLTANTAWR